MIGMLRISNRKHAFKIEDSILLDKNNFIAIKDDPEKIDCHTTLYDIGYEKLDEVLSHAGSIDLIDIDENILSKIEERDFYDTFYLLNSLTKSGKTITGSNYQNINSDLIDVTLQGRASENKQIWLAGCSITEGIGVKKEDTYGETLSRTLGLCYSNLSKRGSSLPWQADQILRSNIKSNDIVIWGLTSTNRVDIANGWILKSYSINNYLKDVEPFQKYWNVEYFMSQTQLLTAMRSIFQVINFCDKIGAELTLINLLDTSIIPYMLRDHKIFVDEARKDFIDIGHDGLHPGPMQHAKYADTIMDHWRKHG